MRLVWATLLLLTPSLVLLRVVKTQARQPVALELGPAAADQIDAAEGSLPGSPETCASQSAPETEPKATKRGDYSA